MISQVIAGDPAALDDEALSARLLELDAARRSLDAAETAALMAWDARQGWVADGSCTGAAWLRHRTGMSQAAAREKLRTARSLRSMPATHAAFQSGELSFEEVRMLAGAHALDGEVFARDERVLVDAAKRFGCDDLRRIVAHWKSCADPDGASAGAAEQWARRRARLAKTYDGMWVLDGLLDPESGAVLKGVLDAIGEELFRADAQVADGPAAVASRSSAQRSADALVEMAQRARACDASPANRGRPGLVVTVDYDVLVARTGGAAETTYGDVLTGDAARRLACDAHYVRAVTDGGSEILDLGRSTPTPNTAQRRALALRDGGCLFPSCDRPPAWCDAHHLDPYRRGSATGGRTDLDDLGLFCRHHHRLLHEGGYRAWRDTDGAIRFARPDGREIPSRDRPSVINRQRWRPPRPPRPRSRTRIARDTHRARQRVAASCTARPVA